MNNVTTDIVAKLWNLCNIFKDDGVTYYQYVTEIVYTQMTKPDGFTRRASGDGVTNFHLVVRDHNAINEQLHQLPALRKCRRR